MNRGDIWLVALPFAGGREQGGQRPAVIVQDFAYGQRSPLVLVVPVTSHQTALRFPATVALPPALSNGLTLPSVALVFQTRALDRSRFVQKLGALSQAELDTVLAELNKLTGQ